MPDPFHSVTRVTTWINDSAGEIVITAGATRSMRLHAPQAPSNPTSRIHVRSLPMPPCPIRLRCRPSRGVAPTSREIHAAINVDHSLGHGVVAAWTLGRNHRIHRLSRIPCTLLEELFEVQEPKARHGATGARGTTRNTRGPGTPRTESAARGKSDALHFKLPNIFQGPPPRDKTFTMTSQVP